MIALTLLAMGAAAFYSLFPMLAKSHHISDSEQQGTQIATKMVERLQLLGPSKLDRTNLSGMLLIDNNSMASPYTFNNCPIDDSTNYSPARALKNGKGTLTVSDVGYNSKMAVVTVTWKSVTGKTESVTMGTILGGYR